MDKRTEKTKQKIHTAFLKLAPRGEDILRISVMDIAKEAGISRSTFYSHYSDIGELTDAVSDQVTEDLVREVDHNLTHGASITEVFYQVLTFVRGIREVQAELLLSALPKVLSDRYSENVPADIAPKDRRQFALFLTSGLSGLILDWKKNGCRQSVEDMVRIMTTASSLNSSTPKK